PKGRRTVIDLINTNERIVPVGRLDRNTTGVLLLTTDYELVNKLTHPKYEIERVYRARIDSPLTLKEFKELNAVKLNSFLYQLDPLFGDSFFRQFQFLHLTP
ncbi:pseudouridine synthase, partial [Mycoplasmopsis bovis]|uniref:pseudouridine synthase n=1 Tax=Mycoplasmopsis bovis TaxID=28903 RepID=UPI003D297D10